MNKADFGKDFHWGVSIAAAQNEGAIDADGRGLSIWDVFASRRGKIRSGHSPMVACDFYNRYKEDIWLAKELGFNAFRFSISWPRILPEGTGRINPEGLRYYHNVIDTCLEAGLTPFVTLYHWDLPHALQKEGGWVSTLADAWFGAYVRVCALAFGDKVKDWIILNEPISFTALGYMLGTHAPGKRGVSNFLPAVHNAAMAQAAGGRIIRSEVSKANIGTSFSFSEIVPHSTNEPDMLAAERVDMMMNRLFIEPVLSGQYPLMENFPLLEKIYLRNKAWRYADKLKFDFDFIGVQSYFPLVIRHSSLIPHIQSAQVKASIRNVPHTDMGWEINPGSFYRTLQRVGSYAGVKNILVTENGAAYADRLVQGKVNDHRRREYFEQHVQSVLQARKDGIPVNGYFAWTLTDNFEWSEGYHPRFGLVYVDHHTQERTVKQSGKWWQGFLTE
jgi:beta-glucosidase